jgi:hypothetical protein
LGEVKEKLRGFMTEARTGRGARLEIATDASEIGCLPWEWLAAPGAQEPFIAGERRSLVRSYPRERESANRPLKAPLRVLFVAPHLPGETVNVSEGLVLELSETLKGRRGVEVRTLAGGEASVERFEDALIESPHVVHFEGYVGDSHFSGEQQPFLQLLPPPGVTPGGVESQLLLPRLRETLDTAGVRLLVVGGCPYLFPTNGLPHPLLRLAEGLIRGGLPAFLAPVRNVDETTAFEFTRAFYRHLSEGLPLETAVARARLGLLGRGGDWTAFALFSDAATLDSGVLPEVSRQ